MSKHIAKLAGRWNGTFNGQGQIISTGFETTTSLPKEFGGLGVGASPEDLFLSSIASCHLITLGIILNKAGVNYDDLSIDGQLITSTGQQAAIEEVILTVKIKSEIGLEKLQELNSKVEGFCLIAKAMNKNIKKTVNFQKN